MATVFFVVTCIVGSYFINKAVTRDQNALTHDPTYLYVKCDLLREAVTNKNKELSFEYKDKEYEQQFQEQNCCIRHITFFIWIFYFVVFAGLNFVSNLDLSFSVAPEVKISK